MNRPGFERIAISLVAAALVTGPVIAALASTVIWVGAPRVPIAALAGLVGVGAAIAAVRLLAPRLPEALVGSARRHRVRAVLWGVLALLCLAQVGRSSFFMANPANKFGAAVPIE